VMSQAPAKPVTFPGSPFAARSCKLGCCWCCGYRRSRCHVLTPALSQIAAASLWIYLTH
jgi:hypothetical protein